MTHAELIATLEAATGPSRELDLHICRVALNSEPLGHAAGLPDELLLDQPFGPFFRYTSSIDAALTLVPEGLRWRVSYVPVHQFASASVSDGSIFSPNTKEWEGKHTTPAIALCLAALKARKETT